ncbi:DUF123 domain-containing protein [Thiorhodococcus mannitoliphagus]|uniref:GIY-YIG nuclease family protein n=1 Tax=Thiorhodococcus mannitoliphagus TaxID=329406 RepID=UPI0030B8B5F3
MLTLDSGTLLYVGSALGPGGVAARCRHHQRMATRPHWHLDYLRPHCDIIAFWVAYGDERLEHRWALALGEWPGARWPLARFGASDCRCPAHLIRLPEAPTAQSLAGILGVGRWLESIPAGRAPRQTAAQPSRSVRSARRATE